MSTPPAHIETFTPTNSAHWREWLQQHHKSKQAVWLICYKKNAGIPTVTWSDAVDEALCFGWIDAIRKTVDHQSFMQRFTRRKPNSGWSKINKEKIEKLTAQGLMTAAGLEVVQIAKQNGSWLLLDEAETMEIPQDLGALFATHPGAADWFSGLSKSVRKRILHWVTTAKRPETRHNRATEVARMAATGQIPKQF